MVDGDGNIHFEPVNMGQALSVLADVVASYVSSVQNSAIEDKKTATQLNVTIFLHSLLMTSFLRGPPAPIAEGLRVHSSQLHCVPSFLSGETTNDCQPHDDLRRNRQTLE